MPQAVHDLSDLRLQTMDHLVVRIARLHMANFSSLACYPKSPMSEPPQVVDSSDYRQDAADFYEPLGRENTQMHTDAAFHLQMRREEGGGHEAPPQKLDLSCLR